MTSETSFQNDRGLPPGARGISLRSAPTRSVVVASRAPRDRLDTCLSALVPACRAAGVELVVCRACEPSEFRALAEAYPSVLWMPAPDGLDERGLRAIGFTAADGDIVSLLDDGRPVPAGWLDGPPGPADAHD